jgi:hypothetical protein
LIASTARLLLLVCLGAACRPPAIVKATEDAGPRPPRGDAADPRHPDANFVFSVADAGDAAPLPPLMGDPDCAAAASQRGNAGCSFYALRVYASASDGCFAMFVVNPGKQPAKLHLARGGNNLPMASVARLPRGSGRALTYAPFDDAAGLPPDDVAVVFLMSGTEGIRCPRGVQPAVTESVGSGETNDAFHLVSDRPVIAYQILPYGGAGSHVTSSTLLLPEESWGTAYLAATPRVKNAIVQVIAAGNGTEIKFRNVRTGMVSVASLNAGQVSSFGDLAGPGLSGSALTATGPFAVIGQSPMTYLPDGLPDTDVCCADSAHQQIPPLSSWGNEYVAVRHRSRTSAEERGLWQVVAVVDGTQLQYTPSAPQGAPLTLNAGQAVDFFSAQPFVVRSQDTRHPIYVGSFMTSSSFPTGPGLGGDGDPEFVNVMPTAQFSPSYTFFTDPTYPETNLVVVRKRGEDGKFADVRLDCAQAPVAGWKPIGDYEYARIDLVTGNFEPVIPGCDNGRQRMTSGAPFSLTVWGWGTHRADLDGQSTGDTSYGYLAGAALHPINDVMPPIIK